MRRRVSTFVVQRPLWRRRCLVGCRRRVPAVVHGVVVCRRVTMERSDGSCFMSFVAYLVRFQGGGAQHYFVATRGSVIDRRNYYGRSGGAVFFACRMSCYCCCLAISEKLSFHVFFTAYCRAPVGRPRLAAFQQILSRRGKIEE